MKVIVADFQDGSSVTQPLPAGFDWFEVPGSRVQNGGFIAYTAIALCDSSLKTLPDDVVVSIHGGKAKKIEMIDGSLVVFYDDVEDFQWNW